jgi:iron(III) transport system ATP-binding protein
MIEVKGLHKKFTTEQGQVRAVRGIDLQVGEGEFFTLLGPSGCGKSTVLRCIAGLEKPDDGEIAIAGRAVFSSTHRVFVPPHQRDVAMVFQSYAIWPHMTVYENVVYPLEGKMPKTAMREKVMETLRMVGIEELANRPAPQLSGGQQQRVALARALVKGAKVLLLDEPLSNLDAKMRIRMRFELRELQKRIGITSLYVTHDQEEAIALSDRVAVMSEGQFVEVGTPIMVYMRPRSRFAAYFVGSCNFLPGKIIKRSEVGGVARTGLGDVECVLPGDVPDDVIVSIRPEHIRLLDIEQESRTQGNVFTGTVTSATFLGKFFDCIVKIGGDSIRVEVPSFKQITEGETVHLHFPREVCVAAAVDSK